MSRKPFEERNCAIAQSLDLLGDAWSLLIIRDAFFGVKRFADFHENLGIARNILTNRLKRLVADGVLERIDVGQTGARHEYRLTPKGEGLLPVLTALREWGDEWIFGPGCEPLIMCDRATGERVPPLQLRDAKGRVLTRHDLRGEAGPGASPSLRRAFPKRTETTTGSPERDEP